MAKGYHWHRVKSTSTAQAVIERAQPKSSLVWAEMGHEMGRARRSNRSGGWGRTGKGTRNTQTNRPRNEKSLHPMCVRAFATQCSSTSNSPVKSNGYCGQSRQPCSLAERPPEKYDFLGVLYVLTEGVPYYTRQPSLSRYLLPGAVLPRRSYRDVRFGVAASPTEAAPY